MSDQGARTMSECTLIRPGGAFSGRQGLAYGGGVSAESAGAHAICMHRLSLPPGARARAHL
ncbi:MAG: cupin, partial [Gaiellales bacterium]